GSGRDQEEAGRSRRLRPDQVVWTRWISASEDRGPGAIPALFLCPQTGEGVGLARIHLRGSEMGEACPAMTRITLYVALGALAAAGLSAEPARAQTAYEINR